jgi:hypothetical protein
MLQLVPAQRRFLQRALKFGAWCLMLLIAAMTVGPIGLRPHVAPLGIERGGAFFVLGIALAFAYARRPWLAAGFVFGAAALLEAVQRLVPGRHGQWDDFAIKAVGGLAGVALAFALLHILRRLR